MYLIWLKVTALAILSFLENLSFPASGTMLSPGFPEPLLP